MFHPPLSPKVSDLFDAKLIVLDCKSIMCPGFTAMLHIHSTVREVRLKAIICRIDKKTNQKINTDKKVRFIKQDDAAAVRFEVSGEVVLLVVGICRNAEHTAV